MKLVVKKKEVLPRRKKANPFPKNSLNLRLKKAKAINLHNNHIVEELGNGYVKIVPIDRSKTHC